MKTINNAAAAASVMCRAALVLGLVTVFATAAAHAAGVSGKVVDSAGKPVAGAIVAFVDGKGRSESVYSDAEGAFALESGLQGKLTFWVRKRYHEDYKRALKAGSTSAKPMVVRLTDITDPRRLSEDSPNLAYFARIAFDKDEASPLSRANFSRDCLMCHPLGGIFTRTPRSPEGWMPTIQRMHRSAGNTDLELMKRRAELLSKAFDDSPITSRLELPYDPRISEAKLYRWRLDGAGLPHDLVRAKNGKFFMSDMYAGVVELDPASGNVKIIKEPADGMPSGGAFAKMGLPVPYDITEPHSLHSIVDGAADGTLYLTDSIGSTIVEFDPVLRTFKHHEIGHGALYPHTLRVARDGIVWFTVFASNQVGSFNPKTGEFKVVDLPRTSTTLASSTLGLYNKPSPYGIDVNPRDGSIWYASFGNDKIGRIDPVTLELKEMNSPVRGPRRQRFDASGALWVAGFSDGAIARINVDTWETKIYRLPTFSGNGVTGVTAPYALAVDPKTQEVWVNDVLMDVVWRFLPKEERFIAYPMPLKDTYTRDFTFTKDGWVCTSNNPLPVASLEGTTAELICIDPQGARKSSITEKRG